MKAQVFILRETGVSCNLLGDRVVLKIDFHVLLLEKKYYKSSKMSTLYKIIEQSSPKKVVSSKQSVILQYFYVFGLEMKFPGLHFCY